MKFQATALFAAAAASSFLPLVYADNVWVNWESNCGGDSYDYEFPSSQGTTECQQVALPSNNQQPQSLANIADNGYTCAGYAYSDPNCQNSVMSALGSRWCVGNTDFLSFEIVCQLSPED
jgi:hypothetical protein